MLETFTQVGRPWGPKKAAAFNLIISDARHSPSKSSLPRVAKRASVSEEFARSLTGTSTEIKHGHAKPSYTDRENATVMRLLTVLGWTAEDFLFFAEHGSEPSTRAARQQQRQQQQQQQRQS